MFSVVADLGEAHEAVMKMVELAGRMEGEVRILKVQVGLPMPPASPWGQAAAL